jgi:fructuronate reductase
MAATFQDPLGEEVAAANRLSGTDRIKALLAVVDPLLAGDAAVVGLVESLCGTMARSSASR